AWLVVWLGWVSLRGAVAPWLMVLAALAACGARFSGRARRALGLYPVPLPFALAAILYATPVLFALERGNYDLLVLPLLVLAAWALHVRSAGRDATAGACLALAAWLKIYPGIGLVALVAVRRGRAVLAFLLAGALLGLADYQGTLHFAENVRTLAVQDAPAVQGKMSESMHSISGCWKLFWPDPKLYWLAEVPGPVVWGCLLLPVVMWVSLRVYWSLDPSQLLYPYLAWLTAAATFLPPVSNDYNLVFLPLAALALWDRRDPALVHVLMGFLLL